MTDKPIADCQRTQYWLAELDRYDNPTLIDGAHSEEEGPSTR